jgi:hypothetical protein
MDAGAWKRKVVFVSCAHQLLAPGVVDDNPERILPDRQPSIEILPARFLLLGKVLGVNGLGFFQGIQSHNPIAGMGLRLSQQSARMLDFSMQRRFVPCFGVGNSPDAASFLDWGLRIRDTLIPIVPCLQRALQQSPKIP